METELFLDTSTDRGLLALWRGGHLLEERELPAGPLSSPTLFPSIQDLLLRHDLLLKEISRFSAGIGPGSFTGIRVAVSIQQSLAFALHLPWHGYGSMALWLPLEHGDFVAMVDARAGGIFCQAARWTSQGYTVLRQARRLSVQEAQDWAEEFGGQVVSPAAGPIRKRLSSSIVVQEVPPSARGLPFLLAECRPSLQYAAEPVAARAEKRPQSF